MQKYVNLVDLVKSFPTSYSNEYLLAKSGFDTAENESLKVHLIIQPWDLIFTEPPRPSATSAIGRWRRGRLQQGLPAKQTPSKFIFIFHFLTTGIIFVFSEISTYEPKTFFSTAPGLLVLIPSCTKVKDRVCNLHT